MIRQRKELTLLVLWSARSDNVCSNPVPLKSTFFSLKHLLKKNTNKQKIGRKWRIKIKGKGSDNMGMDLEKGLQNDLCGAIGLHAV